jgi:hypothetical protein
MSQLRCLAEPSTQESDVKVFSHSILIVVPIGILAGLISFFFGILRRIRTIDPSLLMPSLMCVLITSANAF